MRVFLGLLATMLEGCSTICMVFCPDSIQVLDSSQQTYRNEDIKQLHLLSLLELKDGGEDNSEVSVKPNPIMQHFRAGSPSFLRWGARC